MTLEYINETLSLFNEKIKSLKILDDISYKSSIRDGIEREIDIPHKQLLVTLQDMKDSKRHEEYLLLYNDIRTQLLSPEVFGDNLIIVHHEDGIELNTSFHMYEHKDKRIFQDRLVAILNIRIFTGSKLELGFYYGRKKVSIVYDYRSRTSQIESKEPKDIHSDLQAYVLGLSRFVYWMYLGYYYPESSLDRVVKEGISYHYLFNNTRFEIDNIHYNKFFKFKLAFMDLFKYFIHHPDEVKYSLLVHRDDYLGFDVPIMRRYYVDDSKSASIDNDANGFGLNITFNDIKIKFETDTLFTDYQGEYFPIKGSKARKWANIFVNNFNRIGYLLRTDIIR